MNRTDDNQRAGGPPPAVTPRTKPPRWRRTMAAAATAFAMLVVAGCGGLAVDDQPRVIDSSDVPDIILGPTTTAAADPGPIGQGVDAELFFYLTTATEEFLIPCEVATAAGGSVEARTRAVLERLINLDPATSDECPRGLTNVVPPNVVVLGTQLRVESSGNVLELDLGRDAIRAVESTQQRRAIAQLVFTATAVPGVTAVRFLGDGEEISVPVEDRTADPGETVRPSDFPRLVAALERLQGLLRPPSTLPEIDTQPVL